MLPRAGSRPGLGVAQRRAPRVGREVTSLLGRGIFVSVISCAVATVAGSAVAGWHPQGDTSARFAEIRRSSAPTAPSRGGRRPSGGRSGEETRAGTSARAATVRRQAGSAHAGASPAGVGGDGSRPILTVGSVVGDRLLRRRRAVAIVSAPAALADSNPRRRDGARGSRRRRCRAGAASGAGTSPCPWSSSRHPAHRPQAPRQLHRGDHAVRRGPGPAATRRSTASSTCTRPRCRTTPPAARARLRHDGDPARRRAGSRAPHPLPPGRRAEHASCAGC